MTLTDAQVEHLRAVLRTALADAQFRPGHLGAARRRRIKLALRILGKAPARRPPSRRLERLLRQKRAAARLAESMRQKKT